MAQFRGIDVRTQAVLRRLRDTIVSEKFILAGGTALTLHLGHRLSVDLDFFTDQTFSTDRLLETLAFFHPDVRQEEKNTLTVFIDNVKVSFFHYPYPPMEKSVLWRGIPLASVLDIAAMKIIAVGQRGTKRDFVDLYFIFKDHPFRRVAIALLRRYGSLRVNPIVIGKSMVYFTDADGDPDPVYVGPHRPSWIQIKSFFRQNTPQIVLDTEGVFGDNPGD
jgi:predicted nucleotidyltransferase component of viral defense system